MPQVKWERTAKQAQAWGLLEDATTTELLFGGGAGGGKTVLGCAWQVIRRIRYPYTRGLIGRRELKRLKETTLASLFDLLRRWGIKENLHWVFNAQENIMTFRNGSEILFKDLKHQPSDPEYDDLGSLELTDAFIDEAGQVTAKCWGVVTSRIRYRLDEFGLVPKCLGTLNPTKGWPYAEFYQPWCEGRMLPHRAFVQALAKDNPFIDRHYITQLENIRDKNTRERLLNGNWYYDDDPAALFSYDVINDLFTNRPYDNKVATYISGDVARKGRDRMVLFVWHGLYLVKVIVVPPEVKASTAKSAEYIKAVARQYKVRFGNIVLDEDGVGGGVVDNIENCKGFLNGGAPFVSHEDRLAKAVNSYTENFGNLKAQCYYKLMQLAEAGEIGIAPDAFDSPDDAATLRDELGQVKRRDMGEGKVYIVDKEVMKAALGHSPDFADTMMMRMWFECERDSRPKLDIY